MKCCICRKEIKGYGNDPFPIAGQKCCDECNSKVVIPYRVFLNSLDKGDVGLHIKKDCLNCIKIDKPLTLKQLQGAVEGYTEVLPSPFPGYIFVVNEEGKLKGLPFNELSYLLFENELVGNVLLVHSKWIK